MITKIMENATGTNYFENLEFENSFRELVNKVQEILQQLTINSESEVAEVLVESNCIEILCFLFNYFTGEWREVIINYFTKIFPDLSHGPHRKNFQNLIILQVLKVKKFLPNFFEYSVTKKQLQKRNELLLWFLKVRAIKKKLLKKMKIQQKFYEVLLDLEYEKVHFSSNFGSTEEFDKIISEILHIFFHFDSFQSPCQVKNYLEYFFGDGEDAAPFFNNFSVFFANCENSWEFINEKTAIFWQKFISNLIKNKFDPRFLGPLKICYFDVLHSGALTSFGTGCTREFSVPPTPIPQFFASIYDRISEKRVCLSCFRKSYQTVYTSCDSKITFQLGICGENSAAPQNRANNLMGTFDGAFQPISSYSSNCKLIDGPPKSRWIFNPPNKLLRGNLKFKCFDVKLRGDSFLFADRFTSSRSYYFEIRLSSFSQCDSTSSHSQLPEPLIKFGILVDPSDPQHLTNVNTENYFIYYKSTGEISIYSKKEKAPPFFLNDVVGCGLSHGNIYFTVNGYLVARSTFPPVRRSSSVYKYKNVDTTPAHHISVISANIPFKFEFLYSDSQWLFSHSTERIRCNSTSIIDVPTKFVNYDL